MADHWVRLGMAITIIALVSVGLYQFSGRASAIEPIAISYQRENQFAKTIGARRRGARLP